MSVEDLVNRATPIGGTAGWDVGRSVGSLVVAWQHPTTRLIAPVGLLEHGAFGYRFRYLQRASQVVDFQPFVGFSDLARTYTSATLFPLFAQRIMSPRRPDFSRFLRQLDLREDASPWEQLARSEGRSSGDTVQVFPIPQVRQDDMTTCRFLVHGIRYVNEGILPPLARGERLVLRDEPTNTKNPEAILVCSSGGVALGYVPDLLLGYLKVVRSDPAAMTMVVEHVNPEVDVPSHFRLLVRLDGRVPHGYQPMTGPGWETFAE